MIKGLGSIEFQDTSMGMKKINSGRLRTMSFASCRSATGKT
ncbi:MAG: hypothetical protein Q7S94_08535 [Gallionella sp.]|nr:hypothetical protein [Gallionella sp.]